MNDKTIFISVDLKKFRIRIPRATLGLLGNPNYIQVLVHPDKKLIAVRGVEEKMPEAHQLKRSIFRTDNSYEIYSRMLMEKLQSLVPQLNSKCSYRLEGQYFADQEVAVFSMETIKQIE